MKRHSRLLLLTGLLPLTCLLARSIPEPPTLIYGRVVRIAGGREFPVTDGTLCWSLRPVGTSEQGLMVSTFLTCRWTSRLFSTTAVCGIRTKCLMVSAL